MKRTLTFLFYIFATTLSILTLITATISFATRQYIHTTIAELPVSQVVIIPGAAVYSDGTLSPVFKKRVDAAITVYEAKKAPKILVSGDNGTLSHNEVNPARNYLLEKGIPDEDIFLDYAGFDTYSSLYRAEEIFKAQSVIIATQSFHLPRALFIARKLGLSAHGIVAGNSSSILGNFIREIAANAKAVLNLLVYREPKYLGEPVPITGAPQEKP